MNNIEFTKVDNSSTWDPSVGGIIVGKILTVGIAPKTQSPVYEIETYTKNLTEKIGVLNVYGTKILADKLQDSKVGDWVRITFKGWKVSAQGRRYKNFDVEIGKGKEPEEIKIK